MSAPFSIVFPVHGADPGSAERDPGAEGVQRWPEEGGEEPQEPTGPGETHSSGPTLF